MEMKPCNRLYGYEPNCIMYFQKNRSHLYLLSETNDKDMFDISKYVNCVLFPLLYYLLNTIKSLQRNITKYTGRAYPHYAPLFTHCFTEKTKELDI